MLAPPPMCCDRRHVHDGAALGHTGGSLAGGAELGPHVHVEHAVHELVGHFRHWAGGGVDAGVVHQDVQAVVAGRGVDGLLELLRVGDVAGDEVSAHRCGRVRAGGVQVGDGHVGAGLDEALSARGADALRAPGDQGALAAEVDEVGQCGKVHVSSQSRVESSAVLATAVVVSLNAVVSLAIAVLLTAVVSLNSASTMRST